VPPIAILLGWWLLGEAPAGFAYLGGALCLLGVYVSRRPARSDRRRQPEPQPEQVRVGDGEVAHRP
jgi:drug/metabolite transporter (DMT)-like permease